MNTFHLFFGQFSTDSFDKISNEVMVLIFTVVGILVLIAIVACLIIRKGIIEKKEELLMDHWENLNRSNGIFGSKTVTEILSDCITIIRKYPQFSTSLANSGHPVPIVDEKILLTAARKALMLNIVRQQSNLGVNADDKSCNISRLELELKQLEEIKGR